MLSKWGLKEEFKYNLQRVVQGHGPSLLLVFGSFVFVPVSNRSFLVSVGGDGILISGNRLSKLDQEPMAVTSPESPASLLLVLRPDKLREDIIRALPNAGFCHIILPSRAYSTGYPNPMISFSHLR